MRQIGLLLLLTFLQAQPPPAAEPFSLQLTSLSETWLPAGSVIQVPARSSCKELRVKFAKSSSIQPRVDALQLSIDDRYPRFSRLSGEDAFILLAQTREPLGLFPKDEHRLSASLETGSAVRSEWTIDHWERPYIQAQVIGSAGGGIDISLDQPIGGLVVGKAGSITRLRGKLQGGVDAKIEVNGEAIRRLPNAPGYQFDQQVPLPAVAHELVLTALDQSGSLTILILPVQD